METWTIIWKSLFVLSVLIFAGMSVWVTIGGYQDIKILLTRLDAQAKDRESSGDNQINTKN